MSSAASGPPPGVAPTTSSSVDRVAQVVNGTPIYGDDVDCAPILKEKFVTQGYKDIWFAIIFMVQLLATFVIAVYNVQHNDVSALDFGFSTNHDGAAATTSPESRTSGRQADWGGGFPQPTAQAPTTIAATASPSSGNVLRGLHWRRIVLDEAHTIRNTGTEVARAVTALEADRRWCVTGTVIQNSVADLFSLLQVRFTRFLVCSLVISFHLDTS